MESHKNYRSLVGASRYFFISLLLVSISLPILSQGVKIGDNNAPPITDPKIPLVDPSAILELESTSKGLLLPRVDTITNVANPTAGLLVYQKKDKKVYWYDGGKWISVGTSSGTTSGGAQNLAQVLAAGHDASGQKIVGVDSLQVRRVRVSPTPTIKKFDASRNKILAIDASGTVSPVDELSALLGLESSLLLPRVGDTNAITSPTQGLLIYRTADNKLLVHDGTKWVSVGASSGTTSGVTPTLSQVLIAGGNAGNKSIGGLDTLDVRKVKVSPTSTIKKFDAISGHKILAIDASGTVSPVDELSALLGLASPGLQLPRVQDTAAITPPTPANRGLLVYRMTDDKLYVHDGTKWVSVGSTTSSVTPTLSQVLDAGSTANTSNKARNIGGLDSLHVRRVRVSPTPAIEKFNASANKILAIDASGTVSPVVELSALLGLEPGLLLPRVDTGNANVIKNKTLGLLVYQPTDNKMYVYDGTKWVSVGASSGTTGGGTQNLSQVLTAGHNANGGDVVGLDSLDVRKVKVSPKPTIQEFGVGHKLLAVDDSGVVSPVDLSTFFRAKVFKKSYQIPSDQDDSQFPMEPWETVIYYTYKAYGVNADKVTLTYGVKGAAAGKFADGFYGTKTGEVNYELTIPEGVEITYFHMTTSYRAFNRQNVLTYPDDFGVRFHIVYAGANRLDFNQITTRSTGTPAGARYTASQDPQFMNDFYLPVFKTLFVPNTTDPLNGESNIKKGMGYIEDHTMPLRLVKEPLPVGETFDSTNTFLSINGKQRYLPYAPHTNADAEDSYSVTGYQPLVKFRLIYSQNNRMIVGINHPVSNSSPSKQAIRMSIFF